MTTLRLVGESILNDSAGWFVVWGGTGTAKTKFLQALTVGFCRRKIRAIYYHAADLCDGLYKDIKDPDSNNQELYRNVPVLIIDELDKFRMTDWSRQELQGILDHRYRHMRTHVTLFASNKDPEGEWLPADIYSRMTDGRFRRTAGTKEIEGIFHISAPDIRPKLRK